jgi:hypothetical protein
VYLEVERRPKRKNKEEGDLVRDPA